ncbi:MAG: phage holin family protein [Candidatus Binatia bacterium]
MRGLLIRWLLNSFALWVVSQIVPGIRVEGLGPTIVAALVLGIFNAILRPILLILTLPLNLLTLGLFTFVINALMLALTAAVVPGFVVEGFGSALLAALLLSIVSFVLNAFMTDSGGFGHVHIEYRRY